MLKGFACNPAKQEVKQICKKYEYTQTIIFAYFFNLR